MKKNKVFQQRNIVGEFRNNVNNVQEEGYVSMPVKELFGEKIETAGPEWKDVLNTMMSTSEKESGRKAESMFASSGVERPIEGVGTVGKGWMEWGAGDKLPNTIALLTSLLPYTAAGVKFNTDIAAGLGPEAKYRFSVFENGTVTTKEIDYKDAGILIEGRIANLRETLNDHFLRLKLIRKEIGSENDEEKELNHQIEKRLKKQIAEAEKDYEVWERTNRYVSDFLENNNLELTMLQLFNDMSHLGICFPEITLSQDKKEKRIEKWNPKAVGIAHRSALTCRLESMDADNKVNHVYISNRWLDGAAGGKLKNTDIVALPALDPVHPLPSLRRHIRKARESRVSMNNRPTRFILPSYYPTIGRPYYPQPSWWSVFGGRVYDYASTIISDRATAKENSNMWGKIIYIHTEYLNKLYLQMQVNTEEKRAELRDQIWTEINDFLKNKSNNGKTLLSFTFIGNDGKEHDAYRIVDVPQAEKSTADANKTELEEVGSIIFFALEIHPNLIGAVPGRSGSSGGTYQREMYEIKKLNMMPTQLIVLKGLEVISRYNEYDDHLVWRIKQMTLTTLDRNATGLQETKV